MNNKMKLALTALALGFSMSNANANIIKVLPKPFTAGSSFAKTLEINTYDRLQPNNPDNTNFDEQHFVDSFYFTLASPLEITLSTTNPDGFSYFIADILKLKKDIDGNVIGNTLVAGLSDVGPKDPNGVPTIIPLTLIDFTTDPLDAADYQVNIKYYQDVGDQFKGQFYTTTIAAVPEPETYAMMLAGLGLIGFSANRRKATA